MDKDLGRIPDGTGPSQAEPEDVSALRASVPCAAHSSAVERLRQRIDAIVGGHGFVTISVGDARDILRAAEAGDMLDNIDATGGRITVKFPKGAAQ